MVDIDFHVWLIEVNKNPGLSESSGVIKALLPRMLDDSLRLTIDDVFPVAYTNNDSTNYKSPYPVQGYDDNQSMWDFVQGLSVK